ncbi:MAG: class Ib ribonucleoside-diphosphate reductase assembly flavoprotein NrdI [Celeribacter sp.]|jgi:protein involved in ribonucleotide reduction
MPGLIYFSSGSGNTRRFIDRLGLPASRIPVRETEPFMPPRAPFVLICPTYSDGEGRGAVPKQVIRVLNDAETRSHLRGVIASGNRNFGATFALAGRIIAAKCDVPLLARFELAGTDGDVARIRQGLDRFWKAQLSTEPH